jgi:hypothetical protein
MPELFRDDVLNADPTYLTVRDRKHEDAALARANCEDLWRGFEPLATEHFLAEFSSRFHQRWFEMYLTVTLLRAGLNVIPSVEAAPDVRVQLGDGTTLWVEAICPTGGNPDNPDHVAHAPPMKSGDRPQFGVVPREQVTLRVRGALHDKAAKVQAYRADGTIAPGDQALIAVNIWDIPHASYNPDTFGAGAVYGLGDRYAVIDPGKRKAVETGWQHRPFLIRSSGVAIDAAPFLNPGHEHVTGALISSGNAAGNFAPLGRDLILLPNPKAAQPYTEGQIRLGCEWLLRAAEPETYRVEVIDHRQRRELFV